MSTTFKAIQSDDSFKQFLIVSLTLHFSFLLFFVVKNILLPSNVIEIPNSIRVDIVALPDKIDPEARPNPAEKKTEPLPVPKTDDKKVNLNKEKVDLKETQKKALDKIKALEALEKIKNEVKAKENVPNATPASSSFKFKGNIITSGNDFTGLSKLKVSEYLTNLKSKIHQHWELPQWLSGANLKATVVVQIDNRGYVVKNEIHVTSGNKVFDDLCIEAVNKSSPVDPPPDEVKNALITIRFPFE